MTGDHVRSRLDALDNESGHHEGHDRVLGNANAHKRNEAGACSRFVGGGLPGYSLDRSGADLVLVFADLLVDGVGSKLGDYGTAARHDAQDGADHTTAQCARDDALELRPCRDEFDLAVEWRALVAAV